jgi:hypothetical protein
VGIGFHLHSYSYKFNFIILRSLDKASLRHLIIGFVGKVLDHANDKASSIIFATGSATQISFLINASGATRAVAQFPFARMARQLHQG